VNTLQDALGMISDTAEEMDVVDFELARRQDVVQGEPIVGPNGQQYANPLPGDDLVDTVTIRYRRRPA